MIESQFLLIRISKLLPFWWSNHNFWWSHHNSWSTTSMLFLKSHKSARIPTSFMEKTPRKSLAILHAFISSNISTTGPGLKQRVTHCARGDREEASAPWRQGAKHPRPSGTVPINMMVPTSIIALYFYHFWRYLKGLGWESYSSRSVTNKRIQ